MILPVNGRIAIVDDKYKEVKPLFNILSKKRIPFNYYSGLKSEELPDNSDDNPISILFLDLNIVESQHDPKIVISTLHPILKAVCPGKSQPYFLIVWSKKINEYGEALEEHFKKDGELNTKQPVKFIYLSKNEYFDYIDGSYTFNENSFDDLVQAINSKLDDLSLLRNFIAWENIIHKKSYETVAEFSAFYPINDKWDKNSKAIIYRLAKAIVGEDDIISLNDESKLAKAFININSFLFEKVENDVESLLLGTVANITDENITVMPELLATVNSKLHIATKNFAPDNFEQGNIYQLLNEDSLIEKIIWEKKFKQTIRTPMLESLPQLVQLDITPACDYSRHKQYIRTIYGVILNDNFYSDCNNKGDFYYRVPILNIQGQQKFILFDFRFIRTFTKEEIIERNIAPSIKLRREICTDIQSHLANQINRPGISNV